MENIINEAEYINGKLNENGYDENGNIIYEIINGNGLKKLIINTEIYNLLFSI